MSVSSKTTLVQCLGPIRFAKDIDVNSSMSAVSSEHRSVGFVVGSAVGLKVGEFVGAYVGSTDGVDEGSLVGDSVGACVGFLVRPPPS